MRLGVYSEQVYRSDGSGVSTNRAFIRFVTNLPPRVSKVVVFGRLHPEPGRDPYPVSGDAVDFVPLPYYPNVRSLRALLGALSRSCSAFSRGLDDVDAVWIFGPHPMALVFAWIARGRGVTLFLGVRQDYPRYIANRLPGRRWLWAVPVAHALDFAFRRLARGTPAVVLGDELARRYRRGRAPVLSTGFSLVRRSDLIPLGDALAQSWEGELRLLSVSRLHPEKNPLLLVEILAALRAQDTRWRLSIAGEGPMQAAIEGRIDELGLFGMVDLLDEVPNGPELWKLYRKSHAFLHVSLTEGIPQVLFEAQASGLPIVATDVGGVAETLDGGATGLLVPPSDVPAAVAALRRLSDEPEMRRRLVTAGLKNVADQTLEAQLDRLAHFFGAHRFRSG